MIQSLDARRATLSQAFVFVFTVACGNVQSASPDARVVPQDTAVQNATCSTSTRFGAPVPVAGLSDPSLDESTPRLSPDELTVYFTLRVPTPTGTSPVGPADLYTGHRATTSDAFVTAKLSLLDMDTTDDQDPTVSSDGLNLWFASQRVTTEGYHTYLSQRSTASDDFGEPMPFSSLNGTDKTKDDGQNFITADGTEMWFTSTRVGTIGSNDIWVASMTNAVAGKATIVSELNSAANDWLPVVSADKLTVYFSSNRTNSVIGPDGHTPSYDIWMAHRARVTDTFPEPARVTELSTPADEYPGWLSADNCRMYFSSIDSTGQHLDIYMASREP